MSERGEGFIPENALRETDPKLMSVLENTTARVLGERTVIGREYIDQLKTNPGQKIILATTHTSDVDEPAVVLELGRDLPLVISNMSIHMDRKASVKSLDPTFLGVKAAGRENFVPITWTQGKGRKGVVSKEDLGGVTDALDNGKAVVMAAHNPARGVLPNNPGYAAVRAAQLADALVVPIAVQVGEQGEVLGQGDPVNMMKTAMKRPDVKLHIGPPMRFDNPQAKEAGDTIESLLAKRSAGEQWSEEERALFSNARGVMKEQGGKIMHSLAAMLPPEQRGRWDNNAPGENPSAH